MKNLYKYRCFTNIPKFNTLLMLGMITTSILFGLDREPAYDRQKLLDPINSSQFMIDLSKRTAISYPNSRSTSAVLIDSSMNGYGMIAPQATAYFNDFASQYATYRQYVIGGGTSGQIGSASLNNNNLSINYNINPNIGNGRYLL